MVFFLRKKENPQKNNIRKLFREVVWHNCVDVMEDVRTV